MVNSLAGGLAELRKLGGTPEFEVCVVTQTPAGEFEDGSLSFSVVRRPKMTQLYRLIRWCDVIHIAGPALPPLALTKIARKPIVIEHHGYQAICLNGVLLEQPDRSLCPGHFQAGHYLKCLRCHAQEGTWLKSYARLALMMPRIWLTRGAAANIAITQHVKERHALPNSTVIYYGIDGARTRDAGPRPNTETAKFLRFAFVGRFVPEKGIPVLLEAARILRDEGREFEVLLIGDGPERESLEAQIVRDRLERNVRITGFLRGAELAAALEEVPVVVMPSVWEEAAGLSAIEHMMRGRLVIASRIGGLGEVVGDAGLTCPAGDSEALAGGMRQALEDRGIVDALGKKAAERARQYFARRRMIDEHAGLYRKVLLSGKA